MIILNINYSNFKHFKMIQCKLGCLQRWPLHDIRYEFHKKLKKVRGSEKWRRKLFFIRNQCVSNQYT